MLVVSTIFAVFQLHVRISVMGMETVSYLTYVYVMKVSMENTVILVSTINLRKHSPYLQILNTLLSVKKYLHSVIDTLYKYSEIYILEHSMQIFYSQIHIFITVLCIIIFSSRKHTYIILTPLNPTFI